MRLLLISDTHVPIRARALPRQLWDEVDRADLVSDVELHRLPGRAGS